MPHLCPLNMPILTSFCASLVLQLYKLETLFSPLLKCFVLGYSSLSDTNIDCDTLCCAVDVLLFVLCSVLKISLKNF